jgi:hypothetical protein
MVPMVSPVPDEHSARESAPEPLRDNTDIARQRRSLRKRAVGVGVATLSVALIVAGIVTSIELYVHLTLVPTARTTGVVTAQVSNSDDEALIRYVVAGQTYGGRVLDDGEHSRYPVGGPVEVIYDVNNPARMRTVHDVDDDGAIVPALLGGLIVIVMLVWLASRVRRCLIVRRLVGLDAPWQRVELVGADAGTVVVDGWLMMRLVDYSGSMSTTPYHLKRTEHAWISGDRRAGIISAPHAKRPPVLLAPSRLALRRRRRKVLVPPPGPMESTSLKW